MKITLIIVAITLMFSCTKGSLQDTASMRRENATPTAANSITQAETSKLAVEIVDNKAANGQNIDVLIDGTVKWTVVMPSFEDVNNFAVNNAAVNKEGFEFVVEYGSRYKYNKTFYFVGDGAGFYIKRIKVKSFDGKKPDKWNERLVKLVKPVSIDAFQIAKYLSD